jgi:hypothetical protein
MLLGRFERDWVVGVVKDGRGVNERVRRKLEVFVPGEELVDG